VTRVDNDKGGLVSAWRIKVAPDNKALW